MIRYSWIFVFIVCSILLGCASPIPGTSVYSSPPNPKADEVLLVLYREKGVTGSGSAHYYWLNNTYICSLGTHTYTFIRAKPGILSIEVMNDRYTHKGGKLTPIQIVASPGSTYYYKESVTQQLPIPLPFLIVNRTEFKHEFVQPTIAQKELVDYKFVKPELDAMKM